MGNSKIFLYGASGHCKVIVDILKSNNENIDAIIDDNPKENSLFGISIINSLAFKHELTHKLIVSIGNNSIRKKIVNSLSTSFFTAIHSKALVSDYSKIGEGSVVMAASVINPGVSIGKHCIINTGGIVEHDCKIDDFVHVSPNAAIAGGVEIGEGTHIGIAASVIQGMKIGKWVTVGAGAVVINDIPDYAVVVGNPGRIIKHNIENTTLKMDKSKIWLSSPHMGGTERNYVQEAFDTNWIAPLGPNVNGLESDLEDYLGEESSVGALSSGTAAIHLGLILLGVEAGDTVICQSMTFSASANPILYLGATPIFIDSEIETWNLCPLALEEAIIDSISKGATPKAIIAVHLYGVPYKVDEVRVVADKYGIPILEDSAEALGSSFKGQKCGTFGDIGVLSFNGNKIITTSGGGAIVTPSKELKEKALFFATQSRDDAAHYEHSEIGYNYRMSNICAGIGRGQMEVLDAHVGLRIKMHVFYVDLFKDIEGIDVFSSPNSDYSANYWLTAILISPNAAHGISVEELRLAFEKENIESRPLWKPMHMQPIFSDYPYYGKKIAETLFGNGLCLPSGSNLTNEDRARITAVVYQVFNIKPDLKLS
ncbi:4-keto-6-deoxy-N-Acetyl-D-hexosaminyl-(Lipid carrier) aminotransferase [Flavobacterium frigoris PS1]|uniref:4-keto-6-deoxy-N-Acetyl-D-hexosaminyl-(Lipid carrier) aminotransferase n=2 Tax=Flavobacterium frigoris TaxID=229204 RepID=H7FML7_FLAFP|nr:4-keto-6-deoxy-N-Acetyl-D-hexosaminyl-(Lipid carrier) aminotransferase [Flavobacterium frigoris PS1]